mmetsp:Transcript_2386/g.8968  ORF Transcript_2386/g.8968 Transcript_2386/m.8968 type:complete len:718 (-) Transcript_2386:5008-7161(-)
MVRSGRYAKLSSSRAGGKYFSPLFDSLSFAQNVKARHHRTYATRFHEAPNQFHSFTDRTKTNPEDAAPEFPLTKEATFTYFQHVRRYLDNDGWEYHGLRDVVKGLLVDFRVHLEKIMAEQEEKQGERQLARKRQRDLKRGAAGMAQGDNEPISFSMADTIDDYETESDPEDMNEIVKNSNKNVAEKLKDMARDPELERTVYADFLIEVCERIPDVYKESLKHLEDDEAVRDYTKEQFADLLASLEMHIHSMANLTVSPDIPDWIFKTYRVVSGPVLYNYLLEAAVELSDGFIYGMLLRKMKDDHVGINQYSFQIMMRFGEKATKNNLIYAQELMKYMKERNIEPDDETVEIYERIKEQFGDTEEQKTANTQFSDIYSSDMSGRSQDDTVPDIKDLHSMRREDIGDRVDLKSDRSDDLIRDALQSDKFKRNMFSTGAGMVGGMADASHSVQNSVAIEDEEDLDKILSGEPPTPADDVPRVQHSFNSNAAAMFGQVQPRRHPGEGPPRFKLPEDNTSDTSMFGSDFDKYNAQSTSLKRTETKTMNEDDESILKKFGISPEELEKEMKQDVEKQEPEIEFRHQPGSKEDMEDVNATIKKYTEERQNKATNADAVYAVKGNFYDQGFFDPYAQPMKGYDPSIAEQFTEEDFYVEDPSKDNRKILKPKKPSPDDFDAYAEDDIMSEFKKKQEILEKQKELDRQKANDEDDEPDTWCDPALKL